MRVQSDILGTANAKKLSSMDAKTVGIFRNTSLSEKVGHHFMEGNIRKAFIALSDAGLPDGDLLFKGCFQFSSGIMGTVVTEEQGSLVPNLLGLLRVDVHQCAVQVKNQIRIHISPQEKAQAAKLPALCM